ncbi:MAG: mechanosensitive ion channel family protein, partial [Gammaproteobacteria bacterium]
MHLPDAALHLIEKIEGWGHNLFLQLPNIVLAIIAVLVFWLLARLLDRGLRKLMKRFAVGHEVIDLTAVFVFIIVIAIGIFIALDVLGLDRAVT